MRAARIAVIPAAAAASRPRLFGALQDAYPVEFYGAEDPQEAASADACVAFGAGFDVGALHAPALVYGGAEPLDLPAKVRFHRSAELDDRLAGQTLEERTAVSALSHVPDASVILATVGEQAVWVRSQSGPAALDLAATAPQELAEGELLKQRVEAGSFIALLPLVDFVRRITADEDWVRPALRALLMFDDPNLRWTSYGYIDYQELAAHSARHDYHVAMGMVPLSANIVHPRAAELFSSGSRMSLLIHGITHERRELMKPLPDGEREQEVSRAMRQVRACEARTALNIDRVLCAPHGEASAEYLRTWLRFGLEAMVSDVPFPWQEWRRPEGPPLSFWHPATFVTGGLPIIARVPFDRDRAEIVLRAYLDIPLVVYGHHEDVKSGLEILAETASFISGIGPVSWMSAGAMSRSNFSLRREGSVLHVQLHTRVADVEVPPDVDRVLVHVDPGEDRERSYWLGIGEQLLSLPAASEQLTGSAAVKPGPVRITFGPADQLDVDSVPLRRPRAWPLLRSALTESRDRVAPLARAVAGRGR